MAQSYTGTGALSGAIPNYYYKLYLERMVAKMRMLDYVTKRPVPLNEGYTVYFARMTNSSTTPSAYRVQYSSGREPISTEAAASTSVSATVEKFANAKAVQDVTALTAINSTVEETVREQGDQAGSLIDRRIMEQAYGTSAFAPAGYGFSAFAFNTVGKADLATSTSAYSTYVGQVEYGMAASTLRAAVSKMVARNVEPLDNGFFALVCHSRTAYALQGDSTWQAAYQYTDPENMRKGIAGDYAGAKIVIDNNIGTSATGSNGDTLYFSILLGRGALTVSDLDGGSSPQFYTVKGADKFDPVDEFITIGWKAMFAVSRTNVSAGLIVITADGN